MNNKHQNNMSVYYVQYSWIHIYNKHQNNMSVYYVQYSWIYIYNKHQNNRSVYYVLVDLYVSILCTRGFICQYIMYSWIYMSVYYVLVDLYVSILCTRGFICQYIMYSWIYMSVYYVLVDLYVSILCTRGFICQYIMYSWIYMSVYYVLVDLYVSILCTRGFICQYIMYDLYVSILCVFFQVDVIVNSSNTELELYRGAVSLSIVEKGGRSIVDECRERFRNGIDFGEVVSTKAGRMNFKFICHSALPDWTPTAKYSIKVCISHQSILLRCVYLIKVFY